jgi:predicted nucleotide-binding protein (sugar kinase/HSP70/actin superfamily)
VRGLPAVADEKNSVACPIVQASPDLLRHDLPATAIVSPVINFGPAGLDSPEFLASCRALGDSLGAINGTWHRAHAAARAVQHEFDNAILAIGRRALTFCTERAIVPVVVLGRPYTIYNPVLNSNVPSILREQGAIGIPLDCYPVADATPVFSDMYWSYGQRILRAAHQVRRTAGHYSLYCSNYACGPDSFNLHFYAHIMAGKPFAIVETDGHSGDAGTKTRVEAFLHCVEQDRVATSPMDAPRDFARVRTGTLSLRDVIARRERLLIPWMTDASEAVAACLRGRGVAAESLPPPDRDALRAGRRHTSGKECLPIALTLGSLLRRLETLPPAERIVYLMSSTCGPCRFGVYNLLNQIVLERLGWRERVGIWSPCDEGYFDEFPPAFGMVTLAGVTAIDLLNEAAIAVGADELRPGSAGEVYREARSELLARLESASEKSMSTQSALWEVASGRLFGLGELLARAGRRFATLRDGRPRPTVLLVGEIYVRCVPFANGFVAEQLRQRGLRVRLAPVQEWMHYSDHIATRTKPWWEFGAKLSERVQTRIRRAASTAIDTELGWPARHAPAELLTAAQPYLRDHLEGEAVLTLGGPLLAWRHGDIDGVVSAGPHECMPNKIAESQFYHIAENEGLPSITLPLNGDPTDPAVLDNFAFEVRARFDRRRQTGPGVANQTGRRIASPAPELPAGFGREKQKSRLAAG